MTPNVATSEHRATALPASTTQSPMALMGRDRQATQIRHTPKRIRAGRETMQGPLLLAGSANVATPAGCSNAT
ncbi:MAG: hypothetical protein DWI25_07135 [Planctomycetota bacterium]|nr:MAG: hypothetical protein DWI25_07135 [Planctomycetota bacterium]